MTLPVAVVVPYFGDNLLRREALQRVLEHLDGLGWGIFISEGVNPANARNDAYYLKADVLVFNDADTLVSHSQMREAALRAGAEPGLVYAYDLYLRWEPHGHLGDQIYNAPSFGCVAIQKACFVEVGGFDESLETHEDVDFAMRSQKLWPVRRVQGVAEHLWHGPRRDDGTPLDVDAVKARESAERWAASTA